MSPGTTSAASTCRCAPSRMTIGFEHQQPVQRLQLLLGAVLLEEAQGYAEDDDAQDEERRQPAIALAGQETDRKGQGRREEQHQDEIVGKLFERAGAAARPACAARSRCGPKRASRSPASAAVSPSARVSRRPRASLALKWCQAADSSVPGACARATARFGLGNKRSPPERTKALLGSKEGLY